MLRRHRFPATLWRAAAAAIITLAVTAIPSSAQSPGIQRLDLHARDALEQAHARRDGAAVHRDPEPRRA
ncbi:MAG TPA: hypothetical protein PJ982_15435, partial [Lacipirellulaceae bacterium]|nr:hypothetical protein [Lacipirellulaceae bacterium]